MAFVETISTRNSQWLPGAETSPASEIQTRTDIAADEWDRLVAEFADAVHEQTHCFRGAVWGEGLVRRVAVLRGGKVIGLALAVTVLARPLPRGIAYVKFGPLWRRKDEAVSADNLTDVLAGLVNEFVRKQRLCLNILPPADPRFAAQFRETLLSLGFGCKALPDPNRYLVNLAIDEDRQRASLAQKWRYNLKKSQAHKLAIGVEPIAASIDDFDRLFREMEDRKHYASDSWSLAYSRIRAGFPEEVRPSIIMVRDSGTPIAGAVIGHIGDTAHYLYGATSARAIELNAGYAMHWWIITWLRQRGVHWYELGGEAGEQGLRQFKKGLVGREGSIAALTGEYSLCRDPISQLVASGIDLVRSIRARLKPWTWLRALRKS